jgi:HPt (histidine-containing phosphotransfer) domain-containing protein
MGQINVDALRRFTAGDEDLLADLSTLFVQYYPDMTARLRLAIDSHDGSGLREASHQLKSRLGYFQASLLVEYASRLEEFGKLNQFQEANDLLQLLFQGIEEMLDELRDMTKLPLSIHDGE